MKRVDRRYIRARMINAEGKNTMGISKPSELSQGAFSQTGQDKAEAPGHQAVKLT